MHAINIWNIDTGAGNDVVDREIDILVVGGPGLDNLYGGSPPEQVFGGPGRDRALDGGGRDVCRAETDRTCGA